MGGCVGKPAAVFESRDPAGPIIYQPHSADGMEWLIPSTTHSQTVVYTVSIGAMGGRGFCQCADFQCRVGPANKKGAWLKCKHLRMAEERWHEWEKRQAMARAFNLVHDERECGL